MTNLSIWARRNPAAEFDTLVRNAFGPNAVGHSPAAETLRDADDAVVRLELPGVDIATDVTVEVTNGRLVIRGERRDEHAEASGRSIQEFRYGSFERTFRLPTRVTAADISASYDAGILSVRVAGAYAGTEPQRIEISTASAIAQDQPVVATEEAEQA